MENKKIKTGGSAYVSYILSNIYILLYVLMYFYSNNHLELLNFIFIGVHLIILALIVFLFSFIMIFTFFSKSLLMSKRSKDYEKIEKVNKTIYYRMGVVCLFWALPVFMYTYYLTKIELLLPFVFYPIWFHFLYKYIERKIKEYENKIESPFTEHHDTRIY